LKLAVCRASWITVHPTRLVRLLLDIPGTFGHNRKMSDGKVNRGVRCPGLSWKRLRAGYRLLKLALFGVLFFSFLGAVSPPKAKAATYVRVYYGGRPYRGYPYVYRGRYYYHGSYWHRRYYRYGRWHYY
jgi:hypothetical protein